MTWRDKWFSEKDIRRLCSPNVDGSIVMASTEWLLSHRYTDKYERGACGNRLDRCFQGIGMETQTLVSALQKTDIISRQ